MGIEQWSTTPASNVNANTGINWDEGQAPSTVNNSARDTLAAVREWYEDAEWVKLGENGSATAYSISYVSATVFKFAGTDRRSLVPIGRRVKAGVGAGVIYGSVTANSLSASDTQVTLLWDSGNLDASLSYVSLGILSSGSSSVLLSGTTASTFTFDGSGGTTGSITMTWLKAGRFVRLNIPAVTGTSGTGSTALVSNTALAASVRPAVNQFCTIAKVTDNNAAQAAAGTVQIDTNGIVTISRDGASTAFTNSSTCGVGQAQSVLFFIG